MSEVSPEDIKREAGQDYEVSRADAAERVKIQWSIADATMKALLLANGGAMIALFTFVGNLLAKTENAKLFDGANLRWAFGAFVIGLIAALFTHAFAFLSQDRFYNQAMEETWRYQRIARSGIFQPPAGDEASHNGNGKAFYAIAFGIAVLSIACFALGCWWALSGVLIAA